MACFVVTCFSLTGNKAKVAGGTLSRQAVSNPMMKKYFSSKKKGTPFPEFCFATGRGLRQAVLNTEAEFEIFAIDKQGQFLSTDHMQWELTLELFDEAGLQFAGIKIHLEHNKTSRLCRARFTPVRPGNYLLAIKMNNGGEMVPISGSPFAVEVIDVDNRAEVILHRKCLEENWSLEMSVVLLGFSREPEAHRRIFEEIGIVPLLQMARYKDERITENLAMCLENLLMIDQNKVRMVSECAVELVRTLADLCSRVNKPELLRFMGKVLALLVEQDALRTEVVLALGIQPIQFLLQQSDASCNLSAVRSLVHISADESQRDVLLASGLVPVLWNLMARAGEDVFLQRQVIRALANLSDNIDRFEIDSKSFDRVVERMTTTDSQLNVGAAHILANLTLKPEYVEKCLGILDRICNVVSSSQIRFEWEHASMSALLHNSRMDEDPLIGDTTYELNFYFMRILANLLQQKSEESKQAILRNRVLGILVHFARSYDVHVKNEACRALAQFCEHPNWLEEVVQASSVTGDKMAPLITLMCSEELSMAGQVNVVAKMQDLLDSSKGHKAQAMITYIEEVGQDRILALLDHPSPQVQRNAAIVLAGIVKNENYKSHIVSRGGMVFLGMLMQLVKEGVVEVQRSVDYGEVEWLEIIGKGVSGIVWKGVWQKKICAVKRFNEENIAFDEEEFKSELSMMSVLRHPNIVHSLGGCTRRNTLFIIAELFNKGSLADAILNKNFKIDRALAIQMLIDTAAGMLYLHSLNIIHRDLKAGNCLISDSMVVCVTDFGVSKMMTQEMSKAAGTPMYMSPEIINGGAYSFSADTYSFAFIVWELFARKLPYGDMIPWEITRGVCENGMRPDPLNDPIDALTSRCWAQQPQKRPSFGVILDYLRELQSSLRLNGEPCFAEACQSNLPILDMVVEKPVSPVSKFTEKVRRLTGALPAASTQSAPGNLSGATSPSNKSPQQSTDDPLSPGTSSKSILNLLPVRKSNNSTASETLRKSDRERTGSAGSAGEGRRKVSDQGPDSARKGSRNEKVDL